MRANGTVLSSWECISSNHGDQIGSDGCIKNTLEKNIKMLEINLLLLVQVEGIASGCALCEESYMDMD